MEDRKEKLTRLLWRARKGDENALNLLCKEFEQLTRRYFQTKFSDPMVVDDLSQETYLRFLRNLPAINEPMKLQNFVVRVAFHVLQDHYRKKYRGKDDETFQEEIFDGARNPESGHYTTQYLSSEQLFDKLELDSAMTKLPQRTQQILLMKANGYHYEEIAEEMGISESGVKMQVQRGMEKLKNLLCHVTFLAVKATIIIERIFDMKMLN